MTQFKNSDDKLKHIGLMCSLNLHDAFSNLSHIISLCDNDKYSEKERLKMIKEKAENTEEMFRVIEKYKYQSNNSKEKIFSVNDLIKRVTKVFSLFDVEIDNKKDFKIKCKQVLLLQALINLVDNGLCHNDNENKKVLITIDTNKIIISDNGSGIDEEISPKIFDLFFSTKDLDNLSGSHSGIGLYGVKQHIDELGFKIKVENNTILKGANFTILM